jgi:kynurenine formamidase
LAKRIVDLTYPIHEGMTTFPVHWHPFVEVTQLGRFGIEGRESRKVVLGTHTGTHIDAPRHFIPDGATIDQLPLDIFVGPAFLVDFSHAQPLQEMQVSDLEAQIGDRRPERVVLRFDWSDHWGTQRYYAEQPFISEDAGRWLVSRGVRLLALDTPQADSPKNGRGSKSDSPVHKILLGAGVIKLEYLNNLRAVTVRDFELIALPLNIRGGDGAPARCIARFDV